MLAERNELALQLAVLAKLHPEFTISELAAALGWAPLFIINALEEGIAMGMFTTDPEKDTLSLSGDPVLRSMQDLGKEIERLADEILYKVASANKAKQDVSHEQLQWSWLKGVPLAHLELAVELLTYPGILESYKMSDPYDEESVYTFYSLKGNVANKWGSKQFKPRSKASKKRQAKERGSK